LSFLAGGRPALLLASVEVDAELDDDDDDEDEDDDEEDEEEEEVTTPALANAPSGNVKIDVPGMPELALPPDQRPGDAPSCSPGLGDGKCCTTSSKSKRSESLLDMLESGRDPARPDRGGSMCMSLPGVSDVISPGNISPNMLFLSRPKGDSRMDPEEPVVLRRRRPRP